MSLYSTEVERDVEEQSDDARLCLIGLVWDAHHETIILTSAARTESQVRV